MSRMICKGVNYGRVFDRYQKNYQIIRTINSVAKGDS